jgi:N-acetylglucosamine-6-phosphate deacetylase
LLDGIRHCVDMGLGRGEVLAAASAPPAALVGREHLGRIPLGGLADLVVLGEDLEVGDVNIEGRLLI